MSDSLRAAPRRRATVWLLVLAALGFNVLMSCTMGPQGGAPDAAFGKWISVPGATYIDDTDCTACHDEQAQALVSTRHGKKNDPRTPAAKNLCQSCHGPGSVHSQNRQDGKEGLNDIVRFKKGTDFPAQQLSAQCLECHEKWSKQRWHSTGHAAGDVTCADCHSAHSPKGEPQLKTETVTDTCVQCHKDVRAQFERPSHHPIREGKITCSSCHDPHGTGHDKNLQKSNPNATCFQCHQDKRGPFLNEHAPVYENCANCHTPHGSNNYRLLVSDLPKLCQMCHLESRHPATMRDRRFTFEGDNSVFDPDTRLLHRGCINCHSRIHGSNHPSGRYFMR